MKVLMTGFSARAVGSTKVKYDYTTLPAIYAAALRELGHDVDVRVTAPGEHLDRYDRALVHVGWVRSLSNGHAPSSALALRELGDRAVMYVDDWSSSTLAHDLRYTISSDERWEGHLRFRKSEFGKLTGAQRDEVRDVYAAIAGRSCPWPVLVAMYDWGDHESFFRGLSAPLLYVDPTPITPAPDLSTGERRRAWSLATFTDPEPWLERLAPSWPVVRHGGGTRSRGGGGGAQGGHPVVPERVLLEEYATLRGMLTPPRPGDGCGWWRARYVHALASGCVVHAPPLDGAHMGPSFTNELADVEAASDQELDDLAGRQRAQTAERTWSKARCMHALDAVVRGTYSR